MRTHRGCKLLMPPSTRSLEADPLETAGKLSVSRHTALSLDGGPRSLHSTGLTSTQIQSGPLLLESLKLTSCTKVLERSVIGNSFSEIISLTIHQLKSSFSKINMIHRTMMQQLESTTQVDAEATHIRMHFCKELQKFAKCPAERALSINSPFSSHS
jgi:hypothetical protein